MVERTGQALPKRALEVVQIVALRIVREMAGSTAPQIDRGPPCGSKGIDIGKAIIAEQVGDDRACIIIETSTEQR